MADQGPLVRVDTGRGFLIKMTQKDAEAYRNAHPEAPMVKVTPEGESPVADGEVVDLAADPDFNPDNGEKLGGFMDEPHAGEKPAPKGKGKP